MRADWKNEIYKKNSQQLAEELAKLAKIDQNTSFNFNNHQEVKISIRPSENIPPAIFRPDPLIPGGYLAHPQTIRAVRMDIFVMGENVDEFSSPYTCQSCKHSLDLQFWHFCPYCGSAFKNN